MIYLTSKIMVCFAAAANKALAGHRPAGSRAVVLPHRAGGGSSSSNQQLVLSLMPIVPNAAAGGATGQLVTFTPKSESVSLSQQTVAITPLAVTTQAGGMAGQFVNLAPKAVASLVDAAGRPAISGGLQTVTVSTPSGQISLTKVHD